MTLDAYKRKLPDSTGTGNVNNNFNRPPISTGKGDTSMQGWRGCADFGHVLGGTSGVEWNKQYTNWSLDSGTSKAQKFANAASIFGMVLGAASTGVAIAGGISAIIQAKKESNSETNTSGFSRKETKTINKNTTEASSVSKALDNNISTATAMDENTSVENLQTTSGNLFTNINTANQQAASESRKA